MNVKKMTDYYIKIALSLICSFLAIFTFYSFYQFSSVMPSVFYIDLSQQVIWYTWVMNSWGALLFYALGISAWLVPLLLLYAAAVHFFSLWHREWDRFGASIVLIIISSFLGAFSSGVLWHGLVLKGGFLGNYLRVYFLKTDTVVLWSCASFIILCSLIIISRLSFMVPCHYLCLFVERSLQQNSLVRQISSIVIRDCSLVIKKMIAAWRWIYYCLIGKKVAEDPSLLFNQDQLDQLSDLQEIIHDEIWDVETLSKKEVPIKEVSIEVPTKKPSSVYRLPDVNLFTMFKPAKDDEQLHEDLKKQAGVLEDKLAHFGIEGKVTSIKHGPVVTCFEYQPKVDMKLSRITTLEDDLTLALEATSLRILAPIPGTSVVGFEVANKKRNDVLLAHIIQSKAYEAFRGSLPLILGYDTIGRDIVVDLAKMPHLLVAGSTGSGKSVALNTMLMSLLCRKNPDELKLILVDPKRLEFSAYSDIPHLLFPIVTMPKRAIQVLQWLVKTMEQRYEFMAQKGVRSINDYHIRFGEEAVKFMPYIVVIIDELADLMMTSGKQVEEWLTRIAQMARAAGIHMIVATQRPSVDVITGLIKVNFPSRISFRVTSKIDSRTILDTGGAEKLLGRGDMLFLDSHASQLQRIHGAYVADDEINKVVAHLHEERATNYLELDPLIAEDTIIREEDDELFKDVLKFLDEVDEISISLLQRRFRIGYNRSARIIETLEMQGVITSSDGGKTRRVIRTE